MTKVAERKSVQLSNTYISHRAPTTVRPPLPKEVPPIHRVERPPVRESEARGPRRYVRWLGLMAILVLAAGVATLAIRAGNDGVEVAYGQQPWTAETRGLVATMVVPWTAEGRGLVPAPAVTITPETPWTTEGRGLTTPQTAPWTTKGRGL